MAAPSLGIKRNCQSCGNNYYDLNKTPITCPTCETVFDPEVLLKSRVNKPVAQAVAKKQEAAEVVEIDENIDADIEADDAPIDDDAEVLTDDSDIAAIAKPEGEGDELELAAAPDAIEDELDHPEDEEVE